MRMAASILKGRKIAKGVRCIVIPATQEIYLNCVREGLTEIFMKQARYSARLPAALVWAVIWEFWRKANGRFPRPTETL